MTITPENTTGTPASRGYLERPVDRLANLPWPFPDDLGEFTYTVNVEPARVPRLSLIHI